MKNYGKMTTQGNATNHPADAFARRIVCASPYLGYHEIAETESRYRYSISAGKFREHVRSFKERAAARTTGSSSIAITFDDGHISQYERAFPMLEEVCISGTFFVTAGWTGQRPGYMSWSQLAELARSGHDIQSHGWSHALLTQCSKRELEGELARSKQEIEDRLGTRVDAISVPGGRWNAGVLEACRQAGYARVFTSDPLLWAGELAGLRLAGRLMVSSMMSPAKIGALLDGRGAPIHLLRAKRLVTTVTKQVLGDDFYQLLWRKLARKRYSLEALFPPENRTPR